MTDKVLGFKEKDGHLCSERIGDTVFLNDFVVSKNKLVPVVSLEALEKYCKKNKDTVWAQANDYKPFRTHIELIGVKHLLEWAKKGE